MSLLQPVRRAHTRSLWLQEALAGEPEAEHVEPLSGSHRVDICIVGGGYTGLWTALQLKWAEPSLDVMLLEADICGAGASGRNGGFASSWWSKIGTLIRNYGEEEGVRLAKASAEGVAAIGKLSEQHDIDSDFQPRGVIITATAPAHIGMWDDAISTTRRLSLDIFTEIDKSEIARMTGSPVHLGGVLDRTGARIQPALFARGMRRAALKHGVRIWERSPATEILRGRPPVVRTAHAAVVADKVVLATNAWLACLPELRRAVLPMSSDMVATAQIPDRLAQMGWTGNECIADEHMMVHYYRATRDGRIAFGKGGCSHTFLGQIGQGLEDPGPRITRTERSFRRIYPHLADVPIEYRWTGPIDRTESNSLFFGHLDRSPDIVYAVGYSGTGVAPSHLAGRALASIVLERQDEWTSSPINRGPVSLYPYDPVRYFGGNIVRTAVLQQEADLNATRPSAPIVDYLMGFVPSGLKVKSLPGGASLPESRLPN
jgi:glycine/D-amino acid oxidase-like deaminating enzyme